MNNQLKKQIKELNLNTKQRCFFSKSIAVLSLSFVLQGRSCRSGGGIQGQTVKMTTVEQFCEEINDRKDISRAPDGVGDNWLYNAVINNSPKKVAHVLKRIDKDIASKYNLKYKHKDFPNTYHNKSKKTALGLAIEKNYIEIVKRLAQSEHIDINKAKMGSTSLLEALSHKKKEIANILVHHPKIDIYTKDAASGSSPLHLAIEQKYENIAHSVICTLNEQGLREKNKKSETPLHLAIEYNLDHLVALLVNKLSGIADLCAQDNKKRTPLHMAVRGNHKNAFQVVFHKIEDLCNEKSASIVKLFEKDNQGRSVFARAYLPKYTTQRRIHIPQDNEEMFKYVLSNVQHSLDPEHWKCITSEINSLKQKGTINEKYANQLLKTVNGYRPAQKETGV
ncbi:ankyrin repeat domain-containing protein [Cardinium endosymbiont of Bemisia tabaci]|uniref:ankyrin repeat domain-containing protein n=1 Tax=Cardinium endosymbiont of Bemisia tabaci TaxID=672794 RepID=UPI0013EE7F1F|nr:ankyrin repeat domain-containing protein [Cardinium endosymbiont of Bemisia tabaci]